MPFSIIPERGQVSENGSDSPSKESCDVLHNDDPGSKLANQSGELGPEAASCARKTRSTACKTNILAGKSSNDCIREYPVASELAGGKFSNIVINRNTRVARSEGFLRLLVELAKCHSLESAGSFKAKVEPAYACE